MPPQIFTQTKNFFHLYHYMCGQSEVPDIYNYWCAVSLISAAVEDRVWYCKFRDERLYPNLFIALVGPSGLGKGTAISQMMRLADQGISTAKYRGRLTYARLLDLLGKPQGEDCGCALIANPKLWVIMDELQNDVSSNPRMVQEFIYLMTELYTASNYELDEGTRTHGQIRIERPIINWLVGTNEDDLREVITRKLLRSGFTARTCFVFGDYDFGKRLEEPIYPEDYEEIFRHLAARLWMLQRTTGEFSRTEAAAREIKQWYDTRPNPEDELLFAAWRRHHDMLLKFAMISSLAAGGPLVIQHHHVIEAKILVEVIYKFSELLVTHATETNETRPANQLERYLIKRGEKDHTTFARYARAKMGMKADTFRKAMQDLVQEGKVFTKRNDRGGLVYVWAGGGEEEGE